MSWFMKYFLRYFYWLLMAAVAVAGIAFLSGRMGWAGSGTGTLAIYTAALFAGMALGQRLLKASAQRRKQRK